MKALLLLLLVGPACAQFAGLSTNHDGSVVYFSSTLRLRGSDKSFDSKIFRISNGRPELFRAQERGISMGWYFQNFYDLIEPQVSSDGAVITFTGYRTCGGGSGCLAVQRAQGTLADPQGNTLLQATGYISLSPNARYAASFGRNTFGNLIPGAELISVADGARTRIPHDLGVDTRRRVSNDGTVAVRSGSVRLWRPDLERTLPVTPVSPMLMIGADARRVVYQSAAGLARYDGTEEILSTAAPESVSIDENATRVAWIEDDQVFVGPPARRLTRIPEGVRAVALSGDGWIAYAATHYGRLLRVDVTSGGLTELIPRTPSITDSLYDGIAPGSLVPLPGSGLSAFNGSASTPLPRELGDVRVRIAGVYVPVQSISPEMVWIQVPWELPPQQSAPFEFLSGNSPFESGPGTVNIQTTAARAFLNEDQYLIAVHGDWSSLVTETNPVRPGEIFTVYYRGLGPVTPAVDTGRASPVAWLQLPFTCSPNLKVHYAGLAPGMVGIYQVTLQMPETVATSPFWLWCGVDGAASGGRIPAAGN